MIERALFMIIKNGVDFLKANPGEVEKFFAADGFADEDEPAKVEELFMAQTPDVIHGFGRDENKYPLFAITVTSDRQPTRFIGNEGGFHSDTEDPLHGMDETASIKTYSYSIFTYAQHPNTTLYFHELLQQILNNGLSVLAADPFYLHDFDMQTADMGPDLPWAPAGLFLRRLTFSCARECSYELASSRVGRAWKVRAIHVDAAGSPGDDVGGVLTHVTVPRRS